MLRPIALALIRAYQRYLSPRKGYSCAYRLHAGGTGCSGFGYHAIDKHGFVMGMRLLRRRRDKCAWAARERNTPHLLPTLRHPVPAGLRSQAGDCDIGGCDGPGCDIPDCGSSKGKSCAGDCLSLDCSWNPGDCCSRKPRSFSKAAAREDARRRNAQQRRDARSSADRKSSDSFPDVDVFDADAD